MAEFVEVMKQRKRMCDSYVDCERCIFSKATGSSRCRIYCAEHPQKAEEVIMKWTKEHPIKTNADKFKEVFGVDIFKGDDYCCSGISCDNNCEECKYKYFWNKEYKEPKEDK